MNHPEVTQAALKILRSGENFQWYVITLLALVMYVYANEIRQRNWKGIAADLPCTWCTGSSRSSMPSSSIFRDTRCGPSLRAQRFCC